MSSLFVLAAILAFGLFVYLFVGAALAGEAAMTGAGIAQIVAVLGVLIALAVPLGAYMARVYEGQATARAAGARPARAAALPRRRRQAPRRR